MLNLADRYAALKNEIDALTAELNKVKGEIKATGMETIVGNMAIVTVGLSERSTLDTKAVKEILTAEQIADCTKITLVETLRVKPNVYISELA
jgi:translation initiation factor 2B subunit (eIF-2B alpha/beta/delta family)|tara:strand:+ start:258 stop:536 length:279 start_codon:yes stop_codon:yes gene_type:complete